MKVRLWYKHNGETGSLVASGATTLVSTNKYGVATDEEAVKKSLTDALSKALSWLGFSADVHLGMFDDVKYVKGLKAKNESNSQEADPGQSKGQGKGQGKGQNKGQSPQNKNQNSESPQIEGVKIETVTGKDGNLYEVATGDTYNKKAILDKYGFKQQIRDGERVVYRPARNAA